MDKSKYFKASEIEQKFPGASSFIKDRSNVPPPKVPIDGEELYEEQSFRSWFDFVKKNQVVKTTGGYKKAYASQEIRKF